MTATKISSVLNYLKVNSSKIEDDTVLNKLHSELSIIALQSEDLVQWSTNCGLYSLFEWCGADDTKPITDSRLYCFALKCLQFIVCKEEDFVQIKESKLLLCLSNLFLSPDDGNKETIQVVSPQKMDIFQNTLDCSVVDAALGVIATICCHQRGAEWVKEHNLLETIIFPALYNRSIFVVRKATLCVARALIEYPQLAGGLMRPLTNNKLSTVQAKTIVAVFQRLAIEMKDMMRSCHLPPPVHLLVSLSDELNRFHGYTEDDNIILQNEILFLKIQFGLIQMLKTPTVFYDTASPNRLLVSSAISEIETLVIKLLKLPLATCASELSVWSRILSENIRNKAQDDAIRENTMSPQGQVSHPPCTPKQNTLTFFSARMETCAILVLISPLIAAVSLTEDSCMKQFTTAVDLNLPEEWRNLLQHRLMQIFSLKNKMKLVQLSCSALTTIILKKANAFFYIGHIILPHIIEPIQRLANDDGASALTDLSHSTSVDLSLLDTVIPLLHAALDLSGMLGLKDGVSVIQGLCRYVSIPGLTNKRAIEVMRCLKYLVFSLNDDQKNPAVCDGVLQVLQRYLCHPSWEVQDVALEVLLTGFKTNNTMLIHSWLESSVVLQESIVSAVTASDEPYLQCSAAALVTAIVDCTEPQMLTVLSKEHLCSIHKWCYLTVCCDCADNFEIVLAQALKLLAAFHQRSFDFCERTTPSVAGSSSQTPTKSACHSVCIQHARRHCSSDSHDLRFAALQYLEFHINWIIDNSKVNAVHKLCEDGTTSCVLKGSTDADRAVSFLARQIIEHLVNIIKKTSKIKSSPKSTAHKDSEEEKLNKKRKLEEEQAELNGNQDACVRGSPNSACAEQVLEEVLDHSDLITIQSLRRPLDAPPRHCHCPALPATTIQELMDAQTKHDEPDFPDGSLSCLLDDILLGAGIPSADIPMDCY